MTLRLGEPIPRVAHRQAGVFTARQAAQEGWSPDRIRRRVRAGLWVPVLGKGLVSYEQVGVPSGGSDLRGEFTAEQIGWATHLTAPTGALSYLTAGAILGFPLPGGPISGHVTAERHRSPPGIRVHRDYLLPDELIRLRGLPLTSRRRTAVDCLAMLDQEPGADLWAWVLTRKILTVEQLATAVRERLGRRGTPKLLRLLTLARTGAVSVAESRLHRLLRGAGLRGWQANARIEDGAGAVAVVDVLFPAVRLVIEVDGFEAHRDRQQFVADRRRQNTLIAAGYTVLRITWDDLRDRPRAVLAEIRVVLATLAA